MTVSSTVARQLYSCNGVTTSRTIPFRILDASHVAIYLIDIATNVATPLVLNTDYTVNNVGAANAGFVTTTAYTSAKKLAAVRAVPLTQADDYLDGDDFPAETLEGDLDKLTMIAQQFQDNLNRSAAFPITADPTLAAILPTPVANRILYWANTTGTIANSTIDISTFDANVSAVAASVAAAAGSATSASTSATASATSATASANSATAAATSATNAAASATTATTQATNASTSATAAATSATNAAASATSASGSATTATTQATNASTSASAAATSATNAGTSATAAATSATNAAASATAAAASATAAAASVAALTATSTTSLAIGTGAKTFTTQSGKLFVAGQILQIASAANSANYMHGSVTSYSGTSLVMNILDIGGSGTLADWVISISGTQGAQGTQGPSGSIPIANASGTSDALTADFTPDLTLTNLVLCIVVPSADNTTTTPTFSPDGLTVHTITKNGGAALVAGDLKNLCPAILEYNSANTRWELLNPMKVSETDLVMSDVTTNNASTSQHGFQKKLSNNSYEYMDGTGNYSIPSQVPQNSKSAAYTTVLADAGKHILHPAADNNPRTFTIDSNANVAYPIGACITFQNEINTLTIAITSDTLTLMGAGTTGSRTLAANGIATAMKTGTTKWVISGSGLT